MSSTSRDDRLLAPTRWVSTAIVPVLVAAFVILYLFPGSTMRLWGWMVCPHMSAYVIGGGYLAGAWFFTRTARSHAWHEVGVGFLATTVFSSILLAVTVRHWNVFNHDHVSFWAWLLLYLVTPVLLPVLWSNNRRTDPGVLAPADTRIPRPVRLAAGIGGGLQLGVAAATLLWPETVMKAWPWATDVATLRVLGAFIAFPAVTWLWFLFEDRWSSFRITQQTATIGLVLMLAAALRSRVEFRGDGRFSLYVGLLVVAIALHAALYVAMERRTAPVDVDPALDGRAAVAAPEAVNGFFRVRSETGAECDSPVGVCLAGDVSGRMDDPPATAAIVTAGDAVVATAGGYLRTYDGQGRRAVTLDDVFPEYNNNTPAQEPAGRGGRCSYR